MNRRQQAALGRPRPDPRRDGAPYPCVVVAIGPTRYNAVYPSMRNLKRLLAWAHARVITLVARHGAEALGEVAKPHTRQVAPG